MWGLVLTSAMLVQTGCLSTRGMMYLHPERSAAYLAKESKPAQKKNSALVESAVEKARVLLRDVPDGRRRLGGFCTDPHVIKKLRTMMKVTPTCRKRLGVLQKKSNVMGVVFWSLVGATAGTGIMALVGGAAASDDIKAGVVLGFGIPMLTFALVNGLGPFSRIQDQNKAKGMRLDNYMWTLRQRVSVEVCTAPNKATAYHRLNKIAERLNYLCTSTKPDNGLYTLPNQ